MNTTELRAMIKQHIPSAEVTVNSDDNVHFQVVVMSEVFEGVTRVKRQQMVYAAIHDLILDGSLHAIALKTVTPNEIG